MNPEIQAPAIEYQIHRGAKHQEEVSAKDLHDVPFYYQSIDFDELVREYPPAPDFFRGVFKLGIEEIRALQEQRLRGAVARAYQSPSTAASGTRPASNLAISRPSRT